MTKTTTNKNTHRKWKTKEATHVQKSGVVGDTEQMWWCRPHYLSPKSYSVLGLQYVDAVVTVLVAVSIFPFSYENKK